MNEKKGEAIEVRFYRRIHGRNTTTIKFSKNENKRTRLFSNRKRRYIIKNDALEILTHTGYAKKERGNQRVTYLSGLFK